ncbi:hypothetical protein [Mesorhizobium huakuii]|uniref:Uncharacterized protein n=1 Tax=Mesorhizobium huakuii TaxID=28104 RepID=A0ABZ0VMT1_9HYPH|nr:hypothetical protein [Mesorhizobium huakuii]WQB98676.1 hypothetical protein U0R22_002840 [Mesorhizobium huakuii]
MATVDTSDPLRSKRLISRSGSAILFDENIEDYKPSDPEVKSFNLSDIRGIDSESYGQFSEPMVRLCNNSADLSWNIGVVDDAFKNNSLPIQFFSLTKRSALYLSEPRYFPEKGTAEFYYSSIKGAACRGEQGNFSCDIDMIAQKMSAPVKDGRIMISESVTSDDAVTAQLLSASRQAIQAGIVWCHWKAQAGLLGQPFEFPF